MRGAFSRRRRRERAQEYLNRREREKKKNIRTPRVTRLARQGEHDSHSVPRTGRSTGDEADTEGI